MAQQGVSANRLELLQIADAVAREKSIDRMLVIGAMEDAIQKAAKSRYGSENEIRAEIDPKTGEIRLARLLEVVEAVVQDAVEISLKDARNSASLAQASALSGWAWTSCSNVFRAPSRSNRACWA